MPTIISTSNYDSIAWRVITRRRDFTLPPISATMRQLICEPRLVVADDDSDCDDSDCDDSDCDDDEFNIYGPLFICECGHVERGQDADDCRYLCTIHGDCGCVDCDYDDCEACEAAECHQKDVCGTCEAKYDEQEDARLAAARREVWAETLAPILARRKAESSEPPTVEYILLALRRAKETSR